MDREQRRRLAMQVNSLLADRQQLISKLGMMMEGRRDVYGAAGYPQTLTFEDFFGAYQRQDIAHRVVAAKPDETWRLSPLILDGADAKSGRNNTPFAKAVQALADGSIIGEIEQSFGLWHKLHRLDRVSGIGRYGVLYLGLRDGAEPFEPLQRGAVSSPKDLLYLSVFHEGNAKIDQYVTDAQNPRYGLPEFYTLTVDNGEEGGSGRTMRAHWSRCIHVAEELDSNEVYGAPRLERCFNRMVDMLKILAGSGEAAWKLLDPGYTIRADEGKRLPTDEAQLLQLESQIEDFINGYTRWLMLEGMSTEALPGSVQDPTGLLTINVALISAATNIPQRILLGSERGELSSKQDERNWATHIQTRQSNHVTPNILRPLLSRLVYAGVLPKPTSGKMAVQWENLLEANRVEEAQTAKTAAEALHAAKAKVDPKVFVETYLPELPVTAIEEAPEPQPVQQIPEGEAETPEEVAANAAPFWRMADGRWWYAYP